MASHSFPGQKNSYGAPTRQNNHHPLGQDHDSAASQCEQEEISAPPPRSQTVLSRNELVNDPEVKAILEAQVKQVEQQWKKRLDQLLALLANATELSTENAQKYKNAEKREVRAEEQLREAVEEMRNAMSCAKLMKKNIYEAAQRIVELEHELSVLRRSERENKAQNERQHEAQPGIAQTSTRLQQTPLSNKQRHAYTLTQVAPEIGQEEEGKAPSEMRELYDAWNQDLHLET